MMSQRTVYCDNNATTPLAPEAWEAMAEHLTQNYGNPSSVHAMGIEAERALKQARQDMSHLGRVKDQEVVFTSGGTESVNMAIKGAALGQRRRGKHIITSPTEHEAVLASCHHLAKYHGFQVEYADVDQTGKVDVDDIYQRLRPDTTLVAIMHVNNELGTINPVETIAKEVKHYSPHIVTCVDGAQAFGKLPLNLNDIDCYAVSGHKLHGPKGSGLLFVKQHVKLLPLFSGGGQEFSKRSGTENLPGIIGLSRAAMLAYDQLHATDAHFRQLRQQFLSGLSGLTEVTRLSPDDGLPNTVGVAFPGLPGEVILNMLGDHGIYVSTGSACGGAKKNPSHVLQAVQLPKKTIQSALRFSFSRYHTRDDVDYIVQTLHSIIPQIKEMSS